jgi:hypothetical protein
LFVSTIKLTRLVDCWKIQFAASPSLSDRGKLLKSEGAVNRKDGKRSPAPHICSIEPPYVQNRTLWRPA